MGNLNNFSMSENKYEVCTVLYWVQKIFATTMFISLVTWIFGHAGGVGFQDEPKLEFNFHPMLMSFAFIFINGEAITLYRGCRYVAKKRTKAAHGILQFSGLILASFGLKAAWDSHNYEAKPIPNLYSFHSWMGITTFSIFILQFLGGFLTYALPYASMDLRKKAMPYHRLGGIVILLMTLTSAMLGYSEKAAWAFKCWTVDKKFCPILFFGNIFALSMVCYVITVFLIVIQPEWIRKPLPGEGPVPVNEEESAHED
uniref:Cytochrome b561 domain-containing protein n=1 Tax=Panagrolaimus superbus TaxID=310955 RepID=A0A914YXJ1_9BILA